MRIILLLIAVASPTLPAFAAEEKLQQFGYFIHTVHEGFVEKPTAAESELADNHFVQLGGLKEKGTGIAAGPSTEPPHTGTVISLAADRETASVIMKSYPALSGGVFGARPSPFSIAFMNGN